MTLTDSISPSDEDLGYTTDFIELDAALQQLAVIDPRVCRVIELRFLAGLTEKEAAEVLDISLTTLKRDWAYGRAWLHSHIAR